MLEAANYVRAFLNHVFIKGRLLTLSYLQWFFVILLALLYYWSFIFIYIFFKDFVTNFNEMLNHAFAV